MIALPETKEIQYEKTTLPNGLRVITASMPHTRSAAVQVYVGVGARHETAEIAGVSHFVEHMVFKGTDTRPNPAQISEAIEGVGGALDACTDHEHTNYRALVPSDYLHTALDVLSDMLLRPRFALDDIEKERHVILDEISSTFDSPHEIVDLVFDELLWGDHPLGRDVAGTKRSVRNIKRKRLAEHLHQHYTSDSIVLSVAGNVTHEAVVLAMTALWEKAEGRRQKAEISLNNSKLLTPITQHPSPTARNYKKRTEQTNLIVGVPALPYTHPERYTQDVLDGILGSGMSSRLFVQLREERGLAYSVSSFVKAYSDVGAFGVYAAVDNERVMPALQAIMTELRKIRDERVPDTELRKVKEYIKGHTLLSLERTGYVAHWAGWQELMLDRIDDVDEVLGRIEAVTTDDVRSLAERLFKQERLHLALVGPARDEAGLVEQLRMDDGR